MRNNKLWDKIRSGRASEQQKVDAITDAAECLDFDHKDDINSLLTDESSTVRFFALQTLAIDFQDSSVESLCWKFLAMRSEDNDVRGLAATCIGAIKHNSGSKEDVLRLVTWLNDEQTSLRVKGSVYSAIMRIAGKPPMDWVRASGRGRGFRLEDIDRSLIDEFIGAGH